MSEVTRPKSRQQKFLEEHPDCYFCGGANPASTVDHVPPRACFPDEYVPENFESPACKACNEGTTKQDLIFGIYSMLLDFDESKMMREENQKKIRKLMQGIANNYPEAWPDMTSVRPVNRIGSIITPVPVAVEFSTPSALKDASEVMCRKLTHALYYRETGKILTSKHQFLSSAYQPQRGGTQDLTAYLTSLLPNRTVGRRTNIKKYGDRFQYDSGYKELEDFFFYAAQFGHSIIVWGMVCGPGIERPSSGPLSSATWQSGACGAGAG